MAVKTKMGTVTVSKAEEAKVESAKVAEAQAPAGTTPVEGNPVTTEAPKAVKTKKEKVVKEKKEKVVKEKVVKVIATAATVEEIKTFVEANPDYKIEKSKDSAHQFFVSYKGVKVMYISPNFISIRLADAEALKLVHEKAGFNHPFQAKIAIDLLAHTVSILQAMAGIYPKVKEEKPKKEKAEKKAGKEKTAEVKAETPVEANPVEAVPTQPSVVL